MQSTHNSISKTALEVAQIFSDQNSQHDNTSKQHNSSSLISQPLTENQTILQVETNTDVILKEISEMECDEGLEDMIKYINTTDATLLTEELLSGNTLMEENVVKAINKVRENRIDDYQSYAAVPSKERSLWSAWYLRHVKSSDPYNED